MDGIIISSNDYLVKLKEKIIKYKNETRLTKKEIYYIVEALTRQINHLNNRNVVPILVTEDGIEKIYIRFEGTLDEKDKVQIRKEVIYINKIENKVNSFHSSI